MIRIFFFYIKRFILILSEANIPNESKARIQKFKGPSMSNRQAILESVPLRKCHLGFIYMSKSLKETEK